MNLFLRLLSVLALAGLMAAAALADDDHFHQTGALYTMSNAPDGNSVIVFERAADGRLAPAGTYSTGGTGTGGGLGNQGALILDEEARLLFVVNAGSDEVSVFVVRRHGLQFVQTVASGGDRPVSLTLDDDVLYVLNAGSDSIAGFRVSHRGWLKPLSGSIRPLSGVGTGPAQIQFSPDGRTLIVTEKATNNILSYSIDDHGRPSAAPQIFPSPGATPFGFAFDRRRQLFVSEAVGRCSGCKLAQLVPDQTRRKPAHRLAECGNGADCRVLGGRDSESSLRLREQYGKRQPLGLSHRTGRTARALR